MRFDSCVERDGRSYGYLAPVSLPALVLALRHGPDQADGIRFRNPESWHRIVHRTAGHARREHYLWGMELKPTAAGRQLMDELANDRQFRNQGLLVVTLDVLLYYRARLHRYGVDCNYSYPDLEEALYPVDCCPESLSVLTTTATPDDFDELVYWPDPEYTGPEQWNLLILTLNRR